MVFVIVINNIIQITGSDNDVVLLFVVVVFAFIYFLLFMLYSLDVNRTLGCLNFNDDSIKLLLFFLLAILISILSTFKVIIVSDTTTFC